MKKRNQTFTLLELLIVIAIIGILITILLPSLSRAKLKAQQAVCASNEKQLGNGIMGFCKDNNGLFPSNSDVDSRRGGEYWRAHISTYLGLDYEADRLVVGDPIFRCPVCKIDFDHTYLNLVKGTGINFNNRLGSKGRTDSEGAIQPHTIREIYFSTLEVATDTAVLGDSIDTGSLSESNQLMRPSQGAHRIGDRHFNGINILWADLHVKWMGKTSLLAGKDGDQDYYYKPFK